MTPAFYFLFSAAQIVGGMLALRWLSRISAPTDAHRLWRTIAQVMMGAMILAAIAIGIGEVTVISSPIPSHLTSV